MFKVTGEAELDKAAREIFASRISLAISPFVEIAEEVRVVLIDDAPLAVYAKQARRRLAPQSRSRRTACSGAPGGDARGLRGACSRRGARDRHPLCVGRRRAGRRSVEGARMNSV